MRLEHHELEFEFDSAWLEEAGMENFAPPSRACAVDSDAAGDRRIFEVSIEDIGAVIRNPGVKLLDRKRAVSLLRGFVSGAKIPPVKVVCERSGSRHRYKLVNGTHRIYCSLAAGFSHVSAVKGFDINSLDR